MAIEAGVNPGAVMLAGFGVTVIPGGCPLAATLTLLLKHAFGSTDAPTFCALPPAVIDSVGGLTAGVKSAGVMLMVNWMFLLMPAAASLTFSTATPEVAPAAEIEKAIVCPGGIGDGFSGAGVIVIPAGTAVNDTDGVPL